MNKCSGIKSRYTHSSKQYFFEALNVYIKNNDSLRTISSKNVAEEIMLRVLLPY